MALEAQNNPFTSILMVEAADPEALVSDADPAAGQRRLVVGTDHLLYLLDDSGVKHLVGGGLTDPMTTRGDVIIRNASNVTARLGIGSSGKVLSSDGTDISWQTPTAAARELDYVQYTSPVSITATTEATANTVVTGSSVAYDGSTVVMVEFFAPYSTSPASANNIYFVLYDGSSSIGLMSLSLGGGSTIRHPVFLSRRLTPSNASHTYSVRAFVDSGTGAAGSGAGGAAAVVPGYIRIQRAA